MVRFAVLQLAGCAGCEVSLLNADEWMDQFKLVFMPLAVSADEVPEVDILLVTGGVRTEEDLDSLRRAVRRAKRVVAVGTCAICGGVNSLGNRDQVREEILEQTARLRVPRLLPECRPVDSAVPVDQYLPGCPPTPEMLVAALHGCAFKPEARNVCQECGRAKRKDMRPEHLVATPGEVLPDVCLVNQGYLCIGSSTRGGCQALCTKAGHPCVGCRGPSDAFMEKDTESWYAAIERVLTTMTDIPPEEIREALHSPHLAMYTLQLSDSIGVRPKDKVL